jgi:hypothetical protein
MTLNNNKLVYSLASMQVFAWMFPHMEQGGTKICLHGILKCTLGDHGVKAQGDGWLLIVALIDGTNLAARKKSGYSDPYVIFTCNGKTKTSSIKFHTLEPQWNGKSNLILLIVKYPFIRHPL